MVWPALALIWALQAGAALVVHRGRAALVMFAMAVLFGGVGQIVRRRTPRSR